MLDIKELTMKDNPGYNKMKIIKYRRINDIELIPSRFNVITGSGNGITSILEALMLSEVDTIEDLHEATNFINMARANDFSNGKLGLEPGFNYHSFLFDRNGIISLESRVDHEGAVQRKYKNYKLRNKTQQYIDASRLYHRHDCYRPYKKGDYFYDLWEPKERKYFEPIPTAIMNSFGKFAPIIHENERVWLNKNEEFIKELYPILELYDGSMGIIYSSSDLKIENQLSRSELSRSSQYMINFAYFLDNSKAKSIFIDDFASYVNPKYLEGFILALKKATDAMGISVNITSRNKNVVDSFMRIYGEETSIHILDNKNELKTISHDHFIKALDLANLDVTRM
jgi:hypothetical protein